MNGEHAPRETPPTLEMRLAAIEDKLARLTITEEEMAAYHKVVGLAAARGGAAAPAAAPAQALSPRVTSPIFNCWIWNCYIHVPIHIPGPIINDCIQWGAGPASSGAGFSRLGGD